MTFLRHLCIYLHGLGSAAKGRGRPFLSSLYVFPFFSANEPCSNVLHCLNLDPDSGTSLMIRSFNSSTCLVFNMAILQSSKHQFVQYDGNHNKDLNSRALQELSAAERHSRNSKQLIVLIRSQAHCLMLTSCPAS